MHERGFHVYVRSREGDILIWTEASTLDAGIAEQAIADLAGRHYFQGRPLVLVALHAGNLYYTHEFAPAFDQAQAQALALRGTGRIDWLRFPAVH